MNRKILAGAFCLALAGATTPVWAATCPTPGNASKLKGNFAELLSGFASTTPGSGPVDTSNALPEASTGVLKSDGNGGFKATLTFNAGGTDCSGTVTGTYCVNNDGTGTANGTFAPNPTAPFGIPSANYTCPPQTTGTQDATFTIVDPNRVDFVSTDSDTVVSGVALRQNQGNGKGGGDND